MFQKIPPKFHDKTVQSNMLWLNLNKIDVIIFLQSAHKQGNPSFHFHAPGSKRRYPCTQIASAAPKYFPCLLQFCTGYRIWHASRAWKRKTSEKCSFSHNWKYSDTIHTFSLFLDKFLTSWPLTYLLSDLFTSSNIFSWQQYAVFWHFSNFQLQNGQFCGCPISSKIWSV